MKVVETATLLSFLISWSLAFVCPASTGSTRKAPGLYAVPPNNEAAKAMTEYLAKSHEDKLKNQQVLRQKDDEIKVRVY